MLVSIINDQGISGIFLEWSLHYLAGHKNYYSLRFNKILPVPDNVFESEGFIPPTIVPLEIFVARYNSIKNTKIENFSTIAIGPLDSSPNTKEAFAVLQNNSEKTIILCVGLDYHRLCLAYYKTSIDEFINHYFTDAKKAWGGENLLEIWHQREFLALNLRPYDSDNSVLSYIDPAKPHYRLEAFDLANNFNRTVNDIFNFLEIDIDMSRWDYWLKAYTQLQSRIYDRVLFAEYFECIIESIINNYYLDLTRFKLDIIREAVIQHELLYKHGLTIKGWGLEKFPSNTQELHKLLEKNTYHTVENIYGVL